jgi:hypothetical protein
VQEILTKCPADSFCKLPGGEICVYGLADASKMTQISTSELQSLVPRPESAAPPSAIPGAFFYFAVVCALLVGCRVGCSRDQAAPHVDGPGTPLHPPGRCLPAMLSVVQKVPKSVEVRPVEIVLPFRRR